MAEYTVLEKEVEYIPVWDGNRDKTEPITFTLRYLTNAQRSACMKNIFDADGNSLLDIDNAALVKNGVVNIENFKVNGKEITTAREFNALTSFHELHTEVAVQIAVLNGRQDSKN